MITFTQMSKSSVTAFRCKERPIVQLIGFWPIALYVFAVLSLSNCLQSLFGWLQSQGDRDWWTLGLLMYSLLALAYAVAFSAVTQITRRSDIRFTTIYNSVLASLLFLHGYLYYTIEIDWIAVNSHTARLTSLQSIIRSDFTSISIYTIFLLGAVVAGRINRVVHER
jgi:hypothetical protein